MVVATDVSRPQQQVQHLTLAALGSSSIDVSRPVVIGIGEALRLRLPEQLPQVSTGT